MPRQVGRGKPPSHLPFPPDQTGHRDMLQVHNLSKEYPNGVRALDDVSFGVQDGEFLAVIGLSGAGKSTLLRCINRLVEPSAGRIEWYGKDIVPAKPAELRAIRRQIGMIFQQFNLSKRSSALFNVMAGRLGYVPHWVSLFGLWPESERKRALHALERVGIADKVNSRVDTLSGGQQQRVGIARALMQEPKLILADEPVASLDPVLAHSILGHLESLNRDDKITILCSLHFLDLVHRYASRVIALKDGRLVFDGPPHEIDRARFKEIYGDEAEDMSASYVEAH